MGLFRPAYINALIRANFVNIMFNALEEELAPGGGALNNIPLDIKQIRKTKLLDLVT